MSIYEAENAGLTQWKFRGPMFEHPDADAPTVECPNFFKLGRQWVLFVSPYGKVQYFIGDFDANTCRFTAHSRGLVDYGTFYAPNTMQVPDGRRLVWGWVNGFPGGHGWNGCLSLPRQLSISRDGEFLQAPAPQITKLRGDGVTRRHMRLQGDAQIFKLPETNTIEIAADIRMESAKRVSLDIKNDSNAPGISISYDGAELAVGDTRAPLKLPGNGGKLQLRIFVDRSVLEVFANDTACVTKVIPTLDPHASVYLKADGGVAQVREIQAWPIKGIW